MEDNRQVHLEICLLLSEDILSGDIRKRIQEVDPISCLHSYFLFQFQILKITQRSNKIEEVFSRLSFVCLNCLAIPFVYQSHVKGELENKGKTNDHLRGIGGPPQSKFEMFNAFVVCILKCLEIWSGELCELKLYTGEQLSTSIQSYLFFTRPLNSIAVCGGLCQFLGKINQFLQDLHN